MATVTARKRVKSTVWEVRWTDRGLGRRVSETFETEAFAQEFRALVASSGERYPHRWVPGVGFRETDPSAHLINEAIAAFLKARIATTAPDTHARYVRVCEKLLAPRWGSWACDELEYDDIQGWVNEQHLAGDSPKTISNRHGVLYGVIQEAQRRKWRVDNPCDLVRLPDRRTNKEELGYLTPGQFDALRSCAQPDVRDLLQVAVGTGLRWGELSALTGSCLVNDHMGPRLRVQQAWARHPDADGIKRNVLKKPKTRGSVREVYVSGLVVPLLQRLADAAGRDGYLFTAVRGGPWRYENFHEARWGGLKGAVALARAKDPTLPDPCRFHFLRHTYAWWMLSGGASLEWLSRQMGHASIQITYDLYGGLTPLARASFAQTAYIAFDQLQASTRTAQPLELDGG